ncbi:isochorismatase family protein [Polymorphospora sp. NPDC051019]|uniref:isochorismatase family protein n=1 Tax=Polymorphospora sp. NPDC051019 TaxID=3155725 RepID=UPI003443F140
MIPTIAPYPVPTAAELPANRASWRVDPDRAVLLIHDMQRHFLRFYAPGAEPLSTVLTNVNRLRAYCALTGVPVVYSAQPPAQSLDQRGLLQDFWGAGIADEAGARIVDDLAPAPGDTLLTKWRYSAFHRTDLAGLLDRHGRDQLVVCGVYGHIGVVATACDAFMRDVQPFVVADAVADFSRAEHETAMAYAAGRCAVVTTTDAIVN